MLVRRDELIGLLGPKGQVSPGAARLYTMPDGGRSASVSWSGDGLLCAEVGEAVDGEGSNLVVNLDGRYDEDGDAFEATGADRSGEASDWDDPRAAAAAWRRLVGPMDEILERA